MIIPGLFSKALAFSVSFQFPTLRTPTPLHQPHPEHDRLVSLSVSLPHANPTKSFWTHGSPDANPLARAGSKGPLTTDADIVIIGSGITGVGAAYHLSEIIEKEGLSFNILILEARDFCSGATGRNGGHLTPNVFRGFRSLAETYGRDEAIRSLALEDYTAASIISILKSTGQASHVDLVHGRHLDLFFNDGEENASKADWEAAKEAGVDVGHVNFLSEDETQLTYGPAFPSVHFDGHNLWPLKAVTHFFHLARQKLAASNNRSKLHIHTQTPVTSITRLNYSSSVAAAKLPRRWLLSTPRGHVHAHTVIHATNGYAAHLLPFLSASKRTSIIPTRGQVIATRSNVGTDKIRKPSYSGGIEYWFPRPIDKNGVGMSEQNPLIILGGGREAAGPRYEVGVTDDSVLNPVVSKVLRRFLPAIYPDGWFQKGKEPEMEWTGIMGYTKSGDPLVGPVVDSVEGRALEGQYISAGYTGHGMPRAFGCAEALVQMILADFRNETWKVPHWFPRHFLTI